MFSHVSTVYPLGISQQKARRSGLLILLPPARSVQRNLGVVRFALVQFVLAQYLLAGRTGSLVDFPLGRLLVERRFSWVTQLSPAAMVAQGRTESGNAFVTMRGAPLA
ncbi:MAG: hypothetical protein V1796_02760 [Pseudomonadota bacterium]